jgi:hypothetical protein
LQDNTTRYSSPTIIFNTLRACQRVFDHLYEKRVLVFIPRSLRKTTEPPPQKMMRKAVGWVSTAPGPTEDSTVEGVEEWVLTQYANFRRQLLALLHYPHSKIQVCHSSSRNFFFLTHKDEQQTLALKLYMTYVQIETKDKNTALNASAFPNTLFLSLIGIYCLIIFQGFF